MDISAVCYVDKVIHIFPKLFLIKNIDQKKENFTFVKTYFFQTIASLGSGLAVGFLFAFLRLPVPAPPAIPAVMGIFGITLGYILFSRWFGS
ncbi:DUF1427 family protein [Paenibacillus cremeus]|uniref:DUF1427 family protein n=1 Tax=Paenibacillus cremeus TaxID=2163881 RepID=A0A559K8P5_9BACL|nr:DUF1427 family protein [Paenibacillus cremeus]